MNEPREVRSPDSAISPSNPPTECIDHYSDQFISLKDKAYFNYGGQGPLPIAAFQAITETMQQIQVLGPFSSSGGLLALKQAIALRAALAQELGTTPETIALTEDVSVGCNIALWGMEWQAGDRIIITDCEHQGIVGAVREIQRRFGVTVDVCALQPVLNSGDVVGAIAALLTPETRMVVLSHILWNTGHVLPLAEILAQCRAYPSRRSVRVLVDAAQSVGVLPLNLSALQPDFYAFTGHKWLCGPEGVGGLYVRPDAMEELHPTFVGWRSVVTDEIGMPTGWKAHAQRYEIATSAYPLYAGLTAAIALHPQLGSAEVRYQRIQTLSGQLWRSLRELPGVTCVLDKPPEAGLVSFQLADGAHDALVKFLESRHIFIRTLFNPNCVRACVHYFTRESEIEQLVAAVQEWSDR